MNMVAESLTGWKEKEAVGKSLNEVFAIINEETKLKVENPVEKVLIQGNCWIGKSHFTDL